MTDGTCQICVCHISKLGGNVRSAKEKPAITVRCLCERSGLLGCPLAPHFVVTNCVSVCNCSLRSGDEALCGAHVCLSAVSMSVCL